MASNASFRPRLQFTIRQLLKLVIASAVLCAYLTPIFRINPYLRIPLLVLEMLGLPLVLTLLVVLLAKRGPWKLWFINVLLLPYIVGLFLLAPILLAVGLFAIANGASPFVGAFFIGSSLIYGWTYIRFFGSLIPRRCPDCGLWTMLMDPMAGAREPLGPADVRRCVACGNSFQRWHGGPWEPSDDRP